MSDLSDSPAVTLARLEGKVDNLAQKLDLRMDAVIDRIHAGDARVGQLIKGVEDDIGRIDRAQATFEKRLVNIAKESEDRDEELTKAIADLPTIKKLVYGAVALILISVIGAIVGLVVMHP